MRIDNAIKNSSCAVIKFTIKTVFQFVVRIFLIKYLGEKYLGLSGLFSSMLSMLSLAELGFGSAIIFSMYKPVADGDIDTVVALMNLYKKVYIIVALVILLIGLICTPFVKIFISVEDVSNLDVNIYIIYIIFLTNTVLSYLMSYKRSLLYVNQLNYIEDLIISITQLIMGLAQILIIVLFKNYIFYILTMPIFTFLENIAVSIIVNKKIKLPKTTFQLPKETLKTIKRNVLAMICHKVGSIVVFATDGMLIAKFVGLDVLGYYSNYSLIIVSISSIISMVIVSIGSSVGNSIAVENIGSNKAIFNQMSYMNFIGIAFCVACLCSLIQPFVKLVFGVKMLLSNSVVFLIILSFLFTQTRNIVAVFKEKAGLFYNDRFKPIIESVVNLVASLILANYFGLAGIVLGTIISTVLVALPVESYVLEKNYFHEKPIKYFMKYMVALFFIVIIVVPTYLLCGIIPLDGWSGFAIKILVAISSALILIVITTFWMPYFKKTINIIRYSLSKIFRCHKKRRKE